MERSDITPIIEGKLYAWGMMRLKYPDVDIASYGRREGQAESIDTTSPQEKWAMRHARELRDASVIEKVFKRLDQNHQTLLIMRYVQRERWTVIARKIHVSYAQVRRERDMLVGIIAFAFGMVDAEEDERAMLKAE